MVSPLMWSPADPLAVAYSKRTPAVFGQAGLSSIAASKMSVWSRATKTKQSPAYTENRLRDR
jgi:hypothetical protein